MEPAKIKIRGANQAWLFFLAHDPAGRWITITGLARLMRAERRNVQNWAQAWIDAKKVETREGVGGMQLRRLIAGRVEDDKLPVDDHERERNNFRGVAIEHIDEIIRRAREIANQNEHPRAALKALAFLTELGVGQIPSEDELADESAPEPEDDATLPVVLDSVQTSVFDFSLEEIDVMIAACEEVLSHGKESNP
jgi:hypothetical protein